MKHPTAFAAVMILLVMRQEMLSSIVLLHRSKKLSHYAGDVCFPGGLMEKNDANLKETAIRELKEELGIHLSGREVIGQCHDFLTSQHCLVRPYIAHIEKSQLLASYSLSEESDQMILLPIHHVFKIKPDLKQLKKSSRLPAYYYDYHGNIIWGLTASILVHLKNILFDSDDSIGFICE